MQKETFKKLIRDTLAEMHAPSKEERLKASLRNLVGEVINEIASVAKPEPDEDETEKINKQFAKKGNERLDKSNKDLLEDLEKIVKDINADWEVYIDDNKDYVIDAKDYLKVRICPRYENNFDVEALVKMQDRIRAIALTWPQVKAFVKANFKELEAKVDTAKNKAMDHLKDKTDKAAAGLPDTSIKNRGEKNNGEDAKIKSTKKDDMDYNKPEVERDEDQPDQPLKTVADKDVKKQRDFKDTKPTPPKHKNDKKLVIKMRGKKRD
jgi:hypothetical protein